MVFPECIKFSDVEAPFLPCTAINPETEMDHQLGDQVE